jgi:hypothetical protein
MIYSEMHPGRPAGHFSIVDGCIDETSEMIGMSRAGKVIRLEIKYI